MIVFGDFYLGAIKMKKKRVKCANCGMVYDFTEAEPNELVWVTNCCPKCGSNAYDIIKHFGEYTK